MPIAVATAFVAWAEFLCEVERKLKRKNTVSFTVKAVSKGGMLAALAFVFLAVGSFLKIADITTSVLAGLCVFIVALKFGTFYAFAVYLVTAFLALTLLPVSLSTGIFVCFSGFYSALKLAIERRFTRPSRMILKSVVFVALYVGFMFLIRKFLGFSPEGVLLNLGVFFGVGLAFFAADAVMSKLMSAGFRTSFFRNIKH